MLAIKVSCDVATVMQLGTCLKVVKETQLIRQLFYSGDVSDVFLQSIIKL